MDISYFKYISTEASLPLKMCSEIQYTASFWDNFTEMAY